MFFWDVTLVKIDLQCFSALTKQKISCHCQVVNNIESFLFITFTLRKNHLHNTNSHKVIVASINIWNC